MKTLGYAPPPPAAAAVTIPAVVPAPTIPAPPAAHQSEWMMAAFNDFMVDRYQRPIARVGKPTPQQSRGERIDEQMDDDSIVEVDEVVCDEIEAATKAVTTGGAAKKTQPSITKRSLRPNKHQQQQQQQQPPPPGTESDVHMDDGVVASTSNNGGDAYTYSPPAPKLVPLNTMLREMIKRY